MLSEEQIKLLLAIRNRGDSVFSALPRGLIMQNMADINIQNALYATVEADYRQLASIIDNHPILMFIETQIRTQDGVVISSSPLNYALTQLDTLAWKYFESVCNRFPEYKDRFILAVHSVEDVPDMMPLYNAYDHFIDLGKKYYLTHRRGYRNEELDNSDFRDLKKSWLSLGLQQRFCLPRHLLKDMCYCSPHDLIYNDILLMTVEPLKFKFENIEADQAVLNEFEAKLRPIMKAHDYSPIILFNGTGYQVAYLGIDNNIVWDENRDQFGYRNILFSNSSHPFKALDFPNSTWTPVKKTAEQNKDNIKENKNKRLSCIKLDIWNLEKTLLFPLNNHTLYEERDLALKISKSKPLLPFTEKSGLGYDYALARGFCEMSIGLCDPRGLGGFLFAKANEDYEGIKTLIALRTEERKELARTYGTSHTLFL
ncbi:hypothetical protein [uncultured Legionella sp.]|uniref:hypothetical protein n=1 Tax=uncultured Legionella sp. TaxID=210934 RepID=UPI0026047C26|nr:hypothetical protein [uncultured Legionella sp.]